MIDVNFWNVWYQKQNKTEITHQEKKRLIEWLFPKVVERARECWVTDSNWNPTLYISTRCCYPRGGIKNYQPKIWMHLGNVILHQGHVNTYYEYPHYQYSPLIGARKYITWQHYLALLTCHEISHAVELSYVHGLLTDYPGLQPILDQDHGAFFQEIYQSIRQPWNWQHNSGMRDIRDSWPA